jgi:hypothetical protein
MEKEILMRNLVRVAIPVTVVAALFALNACAAPTITPSSAPSASASRAITLGPDGYGALKLGLTKEQASATGLAVQISQDPTGGCGDDSDGWLKGAATPTENSVAGRLFFSTSSNKLVAIYAYGEVATPEGLHVGSTASDLRAAYPSWTGDENADGIGSIPIPGNDKAQYRIDIEDKVLVELSLDATDQDCYE